MSLTHQDYADGRLVLRAGIVTGILSQLWPPSQPYPWLSFLVGAVPVFCWLAVVRARERFAKQEEDRQDIAEAERRLADPNEQPIPYDEARKRLGCRPADMLRPELRKAFDADWEQHEPAYRYLAESGD